MEQSIRTWKAEEVARAKRAEKPVLIDNEDKDLEVREYDEEIFDEYGIPTMTKKQYIIHKTKHGLDSLLRLSIKYQVSTKQIQYHN